MRREWIGASGVVVVAIGYFAWIIATWEGANTRSIFLKMLAATLIIFSIDVLRRAGWYPKGFLFGLFRRGVKRDG